MLIVKIIGSALILLSSGFIGHYFASLGTKRTADLNEMKKGLTLLKGEVRFALTPFGEAALSIAERVSSPIKEIFGQAGQSAIIKNQPNVYDIWESAVKNASCTNFTKEDITAFLSLGKSLGYLDKDMQIKSIDLLLEYIDVTVNKINENISKEARMYKSLGVLGGLLIIVVLL